MRGMRSMRRFLIVTALVRLWGQAPPVGPAATGIPPKASAQDYDVHAEAGKVSIGVTYMGRSFAAVPRDSQDKQRTILFDGGSFLVVEIGLFPKGFKGEILRSDFNLRVDGQKLPLAAAEPGLVRNALRTQTVAPRSPMRDGFPTGEPAPIDKSQQPWEAGLESSLAEGPLQGARAGNLFFAFPAKTSKMKSLVLEYSGNGGTFEIRLH